MSGSNRKMWVQARELSETVAGLRQRREGLSAAMQSVTRLRAAQESCADLKEQARHSLFPFCRVIAL